MTVVSSALLLALAASGYPTTWRVRNATPKELRLSCTGRAESIPPIGFAPAPLAPGAVAAHEWAGFHNDGLGLNPATWTCMVGTQAIGVFRTTWGESVELTVVGDGRLRLEKTAPSGPIATR